VTIRVLVADDQPLVRAGLVGIIETAGDLSVVAEAGTGRTAVEETELYRPDVVLMDIRMPDMDGIRATQLITHASSARVVVLTTFDLDTYVYAALRAGASGFLLKDTAAPDLLNAIRTVAAGDALLAPSVTRRLIARFAEPPAQATPDSHLLERLTAREREVFLLVADGLSNQEIATKLHVTAGTAKTHVAHLLSKLDARDRIHLVIMAHRSEQPDELERAVWRI